MIKKKVKELSTGQTVVNTKEAGKTESNMVLEHIHLHLENQKMESGKKEREIIGYQIKLHQEFKLKNDF